MQRYLFAAVLLAATGTAHAADDPAVTACEIAVEAVITTPATYARIGIEIDKNVVRLTYDSKNDAGALVRDRADCTFTSTAGSVHMTGLTVNGKNLGPEVLFPAAGSQWHAAGVDQIDPDLSVLTWP